MFKPKTARISELALDKGELSAVRQLESIFVDKTRIYIDYANVRPWSDKLGWHIELKRLKQLLDSFDKIEAVNFYNGYLEGNERSEKEKSDAENNKYVLRTKPVKIIRHSINASSVAATSPDLLSQFVRRALWSRYEVSTIEFLNSKFGDMNRKGDFVIEDMKCNFDVEIGVDMLLDCERNSAQTFVLWSGDSDFADSIEKLISAGKKVILFATARKVSKELSALVAKGLLIFDIQKIRNFICWSKEIKRKGDLGKEAPKL